MVSTLVRWPCSRCWCPPFSVGHVAFPFICVLGLSLRCPPFAVGHSFVAQVCHSWCPPFSVGHAAFQHFYSFVSQVCHCWCLPFSAGDATFLFICFPGLLLVLPLFSVGHVAFLFIRLPFDFFLFVFQAWCLHCCFWPCPLEQVHL